jgi:hypothetical protein
MEYRTVVGVEIATVGMDWHASTGDFTCTFEHLADAVTAANDDPLVQTPRLKLGHESEINGEMRVVDPFAELGDGAPAFGRVVNLRVASGGAKLIGDFIEVPVWLADALPSAYPSRSMEARLRVTTEGNKTYSAVITALALLGPVIPAIKCLADLERFLIEGPGDDALAAASVTPEEGRMPEQVDASVSVNIIRERFNWDWATSDPIDGLDTYYWWACDVRVDPNEVIALDDEGQKWSVTYTTDGKDEVTFGDPIRVREEYVPVEASATAVIAARNERSGQRVLASNLERPEKPAPGTAASSQPDNEEDVMDPKAIRDSLGLAEDATDEEVIAKGQELREAGEAAETEEVEETEETEETGEVAASAELPDGFVAVPADKWAEVQAGSKAGGDLASKTELKLRNDTIDAAVEDGKVPPSEREALENMHASAATRKSFYTLLTAEVKDGGLAKGLVPVTEIGVAKASTGTEMSRIMASFPGGRRSKQAA